MSKPLFSAVELKAHEDAQQALEAKRDRDRPSGGSWDTYWKQREALNNAHEIETARRAQARAQEFLDALIVLVGNRGAKYLEFEAAFEESDTIDVRNAIRDANTPEARRALYTILKALTEIPKSWATSAFMRFLRGTGKQKDSKYHGAGTFGVLFGWKEGEVKNICEVITGRGPFSRVLMSYANMYDEITDAANKSYNMDVDDPDYVEVDHNARNFATNVARDTDFLNKLCQMLDAQGLGDVPTPADAKPKKVRKIKQFHSGDIITKSNLRDLPLPAHVRIPVERRDDENSVAGQPFKWLDATIEQVVIQLGTGEYTYAIVPPGKGKTAYPRHKSYPTTAHKRSLEGATFLGEWDGKIEKTKTMDIKFYYRVKGK